MPRTNAAKTLQVSRRGARRRCVLALALSLAAGLRGQSKPSARASAEHDLAAFPHDTARHLHTAITRLIADKRVMRAHWGVAVAAMDGAALYGLNEGQFFQPASNAKLFTTAAAMALLGPARTVETRVVGRGEFSAEGTMLKGDLLLVGAGDANLSGRDLPYQPRSAQTTGEVPAVLQPDPLRALSAMADQVARAGLKIVDGDVVGDDTRWPWEPYPQDWTMDDVVWGYGAPVSALSVADNQLRLTVTPTVAEQQAAVVLEQAVPYYTIEADVLTVASSRGEVQVERVPGSRVLRVFGAIRAGTEADVEEVAIADPAEYAAMAFREMLRNRGVELHGGARASHTPSTEARGFLTVVREPLATKAGAVAGSRQACSDCLSRERYEERTLASRSSPPLVEDVVVTNKLSQNLHAELMLRELGAAFGDAGTAAQGARVVRSFLVSAGVDPEDFFFYDGSGLSGHDLVTPRAAVRLLTWASGQPWFAAWRASLPVGGVDGSLIARFAKGPLKGKVFAKTGTLGEARALAGYAVCKSGRTVAFSVMVTDHAPGGVEDREVMDRIVETIAALN